MKKNDYGILGWPVKHSLSPIMQTSAFMAVGINANYHLIPVEPEKLPDKINELRTAGYLGWNVTVPFKQAIIPLLDEIEINTRISNSVNTVVNRNGQLIGYSTDGYGLMMSIYESFGLDLKGSSFLFWGTGGAAVSASMYFAQCGVGKLYLVNRTLSRAEALKSNLTRANQGLNVTIIESTDMAKLRLTFQEVDVVIQSTSIGLKKEDPLSIPASLLSPSVKILDMIYHRTKLLEQTEKAGIHSVDGRGMLLHQGAKSLYPMDWNGSSD